ncbi:hypothetical protein B0H11DRAFT_2222820 [Mycena galericulata]|nr:hypothetical protein B0H11DRAFT_2222820 [Mycena galericulata]
MARVFTSAVSVSTLEKKWAGRDELFQSVLHGAPIRNLYALQPVLPGAPIWNIYSRILELLRDPAHRARAAYVELFQNLGAPDPEAETTRLFSDPPILVLAHTDSLYGSHTKAGHLSKSSLIYVSNDLYYGDLVGYGSAAAREVIKATIVREMGHCAVSRVQELESRLSAPEKSTLPWKSSSDADVGDWLELQIFGGVVGLDIFTRATLQLDESDTRILSDEMLHRADVEGFVNYVAKYPQDLGPAILSPSPSVFRKTETQKEEEVNPQMPPERSPGIILSHRAQQDLVEKLRAGKLQPVPYRPSSP